MMKKLLSLIISLFMVLCCMILCFADNEYDDYEQDYYDEYYEDSYGENYNYSYEEDYTDSYQENYDSNYENGIDEDNGVPQKERNPLLWILVDIIIGFAVAFIIMKVVTSNLKSVVKQSNANSYVVKNSFVLTGSNDVFIRTDRTKTAIPKNNSAKSE